MIGPDPEYWNGFIVGFFLGVAVVQAVSRWLLLRKRSLTIAHLAPHFSQEKMDARAEQLLKDYEILRTSGRK